MEKPAKKISEVEIEMLDSSKKTLATIQDKDFPNVKLDAEHGLALKKGIVKDDGNVLVERRFFKRTNNDKFVLYDLSIPLTEIELNKIPFAIRHGEFVKGIRISTDSDQLLGEGLTQDDKTFIALTKKVAKKEKLTLEEQKYMQVYYGLLAKGFGK